MERPRQRAEVCEGLGRRGWRRATQQRQLSLGLRPSNCAPLWPASATRDANPLSYQSADKSLSTGYIGLAAENATLFSEVFLRHAQDVLVVAEKAGAEDNRAEVDSPVITGIVSGRTKTSGWPHAMVDATRECVRVEVYQPDHSGSELEVSSDVSVIDEVIGKLVGQNCVDEEVTMENSAISLPSCSSEVDVAEHNASNISAVQESCPDPAGSVASAEAEDEDLEDSGSDTPLPVSARVHAFELLSPTRKTAKAEQQDSAALEVKDLQVEAETHAEGQTKSSEGAEMASGDGEASGGDNEVYGNELLEGTQEDAGTEDDDNGTIDGADASEGGGCWEVAPGSPNTVPIVKHASGTVSPEEERSVDSLEAFVRLEAELEEGRPGRGARGHADEDEDVSEDQETWLFCADGARRQQSQVIP